MSSRLALLILLLGISTSSFAAPGFIQAGFVERGDVYAEISLKLSCNVHYANHTPAARGDVLRIHIEATSICAGVSPTIANSNQLFRPQAADSAWISSIDYVGESAVDRHLRLTFTRAVRFDVRQISPDSFSIKVFTEASTPAPVDSGRGAATRRVDVAVKPEPRFVINLQSSLRAPTQAEVPRISTTAGKRVFISEAMINGATWYRTQLGYFDSAEQASRELRVVRSQFPRAWIDQVDTDSAESTLRPPDIAGTDDPVPGLESNEIETLMSDARKAMMAGELSRAVQIYTKILRLPENQHSPAAQEFLALARERNGQMAHAKAEYERYLDVYADSDGADRVRQRLAALMASTPSPARSNVSAAESAAPVRRPASDPWTVRTFVTQHYRRDVNQVNDLDEVVSQSSVYTDVNVDVRRRGDRLDFSARVTGGHRYDLLDDETTSGNDVRLSYAYADLADSATGLRGRLGRQTRNTGGVLGRFDGMNVSYALNERLRFDTVIGKPVYTTTEGVDDERSFYGISSTFGLFHKNLDFGVFYLQQDIESLTDREAVGAEVRFFGEQQSLWSVIDYDLEFGELGNAFVQGSWRLPGNLTITGMYDQRRSPFLSLGNAMIGQQLADFADLQVLFTEEEMRQLALDRSPSSSTMTLGVSKPITPKVQVNATASLTNVDATPQSGGVDAINESEYNYYSGDLVISGLFAENDVSIFGVRYAESDTTDVLSAHLDARFQLGRRWRVSPRLRVDHRQIKTDDSIQWIYTPGLRVQYRHNRGFRLEFEGGTQLSDRAMLDQDQTRKSYFVNVGYQWHF